MQIAGRDTYNDAPYAIGIAPEGASHFESLVLQGLFGKNKTNETTKLYHSFVRLWYTGRDSFTFSPRWGENYSVAAVETVGQQQSTGLLHFIVRVPLHRK